MPERTWIYAIHHRATGKNYVGSAVSMRRRFNEHRRRLHRGDHCSPHLQAAWNKHGEEAFDLVCLEEVSDKRRLIEREQAWLDFFRVCDRGWGYNTSPTAGSNLGVKATAEMRAAQSARRKGGRLSTEHIEKVRVALTGMKKSAEHIESARLAKTGRKLSAAEHAHIENMRVANTGRKQTPEHIEKARLARLALGRKLTPEHKRRLSRLGTKHSPEAIEKMRLAQAGKTLTAEHRENIRLGVAAQRQRKALMSV